MKSPLPFRPCLAGILAALFGAFPFFAHAASADDRLHEELRQLKTTYEQALSSGNFAALESLFAPDSSGVVVDNQPFRTFAELKAIHDRFRARFPGVVYRVTLQPEVSQLYGNLAVAHGSAAEYVNTADGEFTYTSTFTAILRRTESGWKLVRSQVTMDPFGNSVVQFFLARTKLYFGAGALAVGAVAGFLIGRLASRRDPSAPSRTATAA